MAHNLLHGTIPPGLGNLPKLKMYNIGFNRIISSGKEGLNFLELLSNSTSLDFLAIDFNLLEGVIPNSIGNLSKVLTKFFMGGNNIYGTIPPSIGELRGLQLLNLSYTSVSGEIPKEIGQLKELQILGLADSNLSGKIPISLGNLQKLNRIDLSRNELEGSIPTTFGNFQNLNSMDLSDNRLNGSIPSVIFKLPKLSAFLNLSQNYLTGPLPVEIGNLENVVTINISDNKISGNIPESIGNCKSLEQLILARNMFMGQIPATLGLVKGLEILDLSSNQLSGVIPPDLQNFQSLQLLNLSFNQLEGEIPVGGVFSNPLKVHLEGNQNLCLDSACQHTHVRRRTVYIIIIPTTIAALCFAVGLLFFIRKGKGKINGEFESFRGQHQMISYDELRQATENFKEENLIGRGSFGSVYKGLVQEGITVAIKVLDMTMAKSQKIFLAECAVLRCIRHRNLVKLITVCSSIDYKNNEFLALVFEFMSNGNLDEWIRGKRRYENGKGLTVMDRLNLAIGVASAVDYLHNETEIPILHCDLKPSNVLLDSDMTPKVGDFGLAKLLIDNHTAISSTHTLKGTIGYIPPEYGFGEKPSIAGDVHSYGILLLELFTGKSPTDESFTGGMSLKNWVEKSFPTYIDQVLDPELWDERQCTKPENQDDCLITIFRICLACANDSPDERISMRDALGKLKKIGVGPL
ncbi:putative LRR receptor-like serine/threonine-protein kinase [Forsythia ovata]|uniref:non-specific serine/threonine protein kinase n=1 Tax=Forsythia ovata TaxID=205694 RepID=A0ABD1VN15_9LAMI